MVSSHCCNCRVLCSAVGGVAMSNKILAVYNTCGISGQENTVFYIDAIKSVLEQKGFQEGDVRLVVSACMMSELCQMNLKNNFGDMISYNFIYESYPLTVTFNDTIDQCVKHFGAFDSYLYLDSGISLNGISDELPSLRTLEYAYAQHKSGPYAMTAICPTNDDGHEWWGTTYFETPDENYIFPIGKATNLHCQFYSEEMRQAYNGRLHADIYANDTSESISTFFSGALKRNLMMIAPAKLRVLHNQSMDGASIGWRGQNPDGTVKLFQTEKSMDERFQEGYEFGFGYEECKPRWLHDPNKFDENGHAKDDRLLDFMRRECFLKPDEFSYENIVRRFEP